MRAGFAPPPPRRSASLRMTLGLAALLIAVAGLAMALQYRMTARSLEAEQRALLAADLAAFEALYEQRRIPALRAAIAYRVEGGAGAARYLLLDRGGNVLAGNLAVWPEGISPQLVDAPFQVAGQAVNLPDGRYLVSAVELPGGFALMVARSSDGRLEALAGLRALILWVLMGLSVVSLLLARLVAARVLGRISAVNTVAEQVATGDLTARVAVQAGGDEFATLEAHVNHMLDRILHLNQATHRLSDSIAHELRTPLNRVQQQLAALPADTGEAQEALRQAVRVFEALLDISAAEAATGERPGLLPLDLSALAAEVFDLYAALGEDEGLSMQVEITPALQILGERSLMAQLLSNLLENAIKYCHTGDSVTLRLWAAEDQVVLRISDTGPGLPKDLQGRLFDRFSRGERDQSISGHGLGLALVQAIAARHGAKLSLPDSGDGQNVEQNKGFAIQLSCPKLP